MSTETVTGTPVHVSMIMDGNGRWAKEKGKDRIHGHFEGVESVRACVEAAIENGVKYLSVYAFSEENWNRPQEEVMALMELMVKAMASEMDALDRNGVRFMVIGNRERLDSGLNKVIDSCMERTAGNTALTLIVMLLRRWPWRSRRRLPDFLPWGRMASARCLPPRGFLTRTLSSGHQVNAESATISCGRGHIQSFFLSIPCGLISGRRSFAKHLNPMQNVTDVMEKSNNSLYLQF